jgi:predicted nuclease of predicted toxin-antitoxin system
MRFLADQDVYASTVSFLRSLGHDVLPVATIGLAQADDAELLCRASQEARILLTRDRDFGGLVFVQGAGTGVIYLRILPSMQDAVHSEMVTVLTNYTENELRTSFVVIEPGRHRIRKLGP